MIRAILEDRIGRIGHHIVRIVNASWNDNRRAGIKAGNMDVYRQYDDGREEVRNLAVSAIGGYFLYDTNPDGWGKPWIDCKALREPRVNSYMVFTNIGAWEIGYIKERYPGFRWMLDKILANRIGVQVAEVIQYLRAWLRWPECERLYNGGYYKLCLSAQFAVATYRKQCEIMQYLKMHPEIQDPGFGEILALMKNGISQDDYYMMKHCKCGADLLKYLHAQLRKGTVFKEDYSLEALHGVYQDYIRMVGSNGHDKEQDYWKYPSDLREAHDKVMREAANIEAAKLKRRQMKYGEAVKKFIGKTVDVGNIRVFVPENVDEIALQASVLHQCLVTADYIGKVINRKCLLVFLVCDGRPMATAEIDKNGKLLQFYGDERDSYNMKPDRAADAALDAWCKKFKPKWRKAA